MLSSRKQNPPPLLLLAVPAVIALFMGRRRRKKRTSSNLPSVLFGDYPFPPPRDHGVPFAVGPWRPSWPIGTESKHNRKLQVSYKDVNGNWHGNMSRAFRANRGLRWHGGMDIYANAGDKVYAPEGGVVLKTQRYKDGTHALLLHTNSGLTLLIGEVEKGSWNEFGATPGERVEQGQPIARVGLQDSNPDKPGVQGGAHMFHIEIYDGSVNKNIRWPKDKPRDPRLLDPTDYLLRARATVAAS